MTRIQNTIVFLLLMISVAAVAQKKESEMKAFLKDTDSKFPIGNVLIEYNHGNTHTHSEPDGSFKLHFQSFPDTLVISHQGYDQQKLAVNSNIEYENKVIFLQRKPIEISEIIINHNSFLSDITKVDLNKFPVNSAQDLLRKVPGLFIAQHAGGGKAEQIF
ncbi:TonB-dependent receptor [Flavobacterium sp. KBS0721]|uniref:TonB-dependent receptor n=1 Tax=Flavobacterium sp. KBS0721 TaxID=1179672 RepID=UPI001FF02741|nr:TonB-dependent receptor [Flavobacterium sp. KBS0721]